MLYTSCLLPSPTKDTFAPFSIPLITHNELKTQVLTKHCYRNYFIYTNHNKHKHRTQIDHVTRAISMNSEGKEYDFWAIVYKDQLSQFRWQTRATRLDPEAAAVSRHKPP